MYRKLLLMPNALNYHVFFVVFVSLFCHKVTKATKFFLLVLCDFMASVLHRKLVPKALGFTLCFLGIFSLHGQDGCTDVQAINFDAAAVENDGSCLYEATQYQMEQRATLPATLEEASGVAYLDGNLWTHNDGGNTNEIYRIDTLTGEVLQTVLVGALENEDWEDMAQSDTHLFVGDFGNNPGNRMDLRIGQIDRSDLGNLIVSAQMINFSYSDQTDFTERFNDNDYDCEAFFFYQDSLHLFTKNWVDEKTRHYTLPATPGTHVAQLRETFDSEGLITGAAIDEENGTISLLGYTPSGVNFMWLLYDYAPHQFFSGNIRKVNLGTGLTNSQTEGIIFTENGQGFVVSENFNFLPQRLLHFTTRQWIGDITTDVSNPVVPEETLNLKVYPLPFGDQLTLTWEADKVDNGVVEIFNLSGKLIYRQQLKNSDQELRVNTASFSSGSYLMRISDKNRSVNKVILRK